MASVSTEIRKKDEKITYLEKYVYLASRYSKEPTYVTVTKKL